MGSRRSGSGIIGGFPVGGFSPRCPLSLSPVTPMITLAISGSIEPSKPLPSSVAVYLMLHSLEHGSSVWFFFFLLVASSHPKVSNVTLNIYIPHLLRAAVIWPPMKHRWEFPVADNVEML